MDQLTSAFDTWFGIVLAFIAVLVIFRRLLVEWLRRALKLDEAALRPALPLPIHLLPDNEIEELRKHIVANLDRLRSDFTADMGWVRVELRRLEALEIVVKNGLETRTAEIQREVSNLVKAVARLEGKLDGGV